MAILLGFTSDGNSEVIKRIYSIDAEKGRRPDFTFLTSFGLTDIPC